MNVGMGGSDQQQPRYPSHTRTPCSRMRCLQDSPSLTAGGVVQIFRRQCNGPETAWFLPVAEKKREREMERDSGG